ncbi:MAG: arginine--tRNA ligase, partial [Cetobacterium sp.]
MLTIEKQIEIILLETVNNLYPDKDLKPIEITVATNEKFGDFQSNFAMMNSKIIGGNPRAIAENVVNNIVENSVIDKIEIAGPGFLNIFLKDSYLGDLVKKISKEDYEFKGLNIEGDVIIDYSSPNIAKRMHIGHLRSTIIGDSIKRMYKYLGYNVVAD